PPAPGLSARALQAKLIGQDGVIDAVPVAGRVRFITSQAHPEGPAVAPRLEDGFMVLLQGNGSDPARAGRLPDMPARDPARTAHDGAAVEVRDLVRKFGSFTAVDHV